EPISRRLVQFQERGLPGTHLSGFYCGHRYKLPLQAVPASSFFLVSYTMVC
ncbi:Hypothetical protein FKW44_012959, partial [Caligus rogercresseyi]